MSFGSCRLEKFIKVNMMQKAINLQRCKLDEIKCAILRTRKGKRPRFECSKLDEVQHAPRQNNIQKAINLHC